MLTVYRRGLVDASTRLVACLPFIIAMGCTSARGSVPEIAPPKTVAFVPFSLQPLPSQTPAVGEHLTRLHQAVTTFGAPHDVLLELGRIGNASSIPFLIEALAKHGVVPREGQYAAVCTRFHSLEALQAITNHDAGRNADDWRAWYDTNKEKSQDQWILEGFAERRFPVADPPHDAFITALIRASDPKYQLAFIRTNALRMLKSLPAATVVRLARPLAASAEPADRRAMVAAVERVRGEGVIELLRSLTGDADVDVAENALRTLNVVLRDASPVASAETVWDVPLAAAGAHILHTLDDRTVVLGIGYGIVDRPRVVGFDLVTHKTTWSYPTRAGVRSNAVRVGDRLYFVSDDRVVHCISVRGKALWRTPLTHDRKFGTTGPAITAVRERLFVPDGRSIYAISLSGQVQAIGLGEHVSRDLVQGRRKVFAAINNGALLVLDGAGPPQRVPTGLNVAALSVAGDVVCVVGFGSPPYLQCLSQDTLHEMWRTELPAEAGAYKQLYQDDDNVYVVAQGRALAFNVATGKRLWATNEFNGGGVFKVFGRSLLTLNDHFRLEWRDPESGEVIAPWVGQTGTVRNAALIGHAVLLETSSGQEDGLRLMEVPAVIRARSRSH